MTRPAVSVVMPFAGTPAEARTAVAALAGLRVGPGDELILADNSGTAPALGPPVRVVRAGGEASPAHARNVGAAAASAEWVLFVDADTQPEPDLLDAYFAEPVGDDVGALAGEITAEVQPGDPLAARYGAARGFLGLGVHLAHPYLPRAAAANLLVRRRALTAVGGFHEGVRAAEDTDFSWRLQRAGWRLEARPGARVRHHYRGSVRELRRQWRGYAAGRAWLSRRYSGFAPEPALRRAARRTLRRVRHGSAPPGARGAGTAADARRAGPAPPGAPRQRAAYLALDALLGLEELAGFVLSNRPQRTSDVGRAVEVVLVADRFPVPGDPLTDYARSLGAARVEAASRPERVDPTAGPGRTGAGAGRLRVDYREDDGRLERWMAAGGLIARHPVRVFNDRRRRGPAADAPSVVALAPAVRRLHRDPAARVLALGGDAAAPAAVARRLAALCGRALEKGPH